MKLGFSLLWSIVAILVALGVIAWIFGVSMIIGGAFVLMALIFAGPKAIENYKGIWFWIFILGIALVLLSALGYGFQFEQSQFIWKGLPTL